MNTVYVQRIERGWAAHFIGGGHCRFHRNTLLVAYKNGEPLRKVVVSTVGMYLPAILPEHTQIPEPVSFGRYYETLIFKAKQHGHYTEADTSREIILDLDLPWYINGKTFREQRDSVDDVANTMHDNLVTAVIQHLQDGTLPTAEEKEDDNASA